ncbi:outer membrane lipid asymmetry maintenance protein MlaD [Vannielia litorea]|uniref:Phospholipid/cholesterol/gamma-HCH transport system substrate-binding protein n=1 Tax=Vannielia litorea TaxID=1217970 RepID=A0A1N6G5J4_9RHOB|nr:outer membrane lipid asymmetry maintenance protein MlaD [Vannielia litorea]SIO02800.1 phospholipid/cholesterol/gamma-HCH transport system substrate-binding protein [Vannielia litorea]
MSENTTEAIVGACVLAAAAGFLWYASGLTDGGGSGGGSYPLVASFRSAEGISVGTDVRLAGVKIGSVRGLDLNAETFRAEATFSISDGINLPEDSSAAISSEGLLGGNFIEIIPGGSPFNLEAGGEIEDTQGAVSLIGLLSKFVSGADE